MSNNDPYWRAAAACAGSDPELFFPATGVTPRAALRTCGECPVRRQCLTYALDLGTTLEGVWGGATANQRRAMLAGKYPTMLAVKIDHRRQHAAALRAAGWEVERIAKHLGISVATVGNDLRCAQQQAAS